MGFVDRFNSHLNRYLYRHRKSKWTKCCLFSIFQMMLVNSWILFKKLNKSKIKWKDFLVKSLINYSKIEPEIPLEIPTHNHWHIIIRNEILERCSYCKKTKRNPSNTRYKCSSCLIPLHANCFEKSHNESL